MHRHATTLIPWILVVAVVAVVGVVRWRESSQVRPPQTVDLIGSLNAPASSADGLAAQVTAMEARIASNEEDTAARIALAEVLVRQSRVTGNAALAARAEQHLQAALRVDPGDYEAQRMLGVVFLSLHRFEDAVSAGERAKTMRPDDAWNYGVIGDGHLELGRYDEAFVAFQKMMDLRPSAASYARASYALELQGRLEEALDAMQRSANATSPRDAEGLAWTLVHVGDLLFKLDRLPEAHAQYRRAAAVFPDHPFTVTAMARVAAHLGRDDEAIALATSVLGQSPSMALAAFVGDVHARNGRAGEAEGYYAMAEAIGRESTSTDESFAGFLAERGRRVEEAVTLAEKVSTRRQDIRSLDALAWACFRANRLADAEAAAERALRTGTRDRRVVLHAAAIASARGDVKRAQELVRRAAPNDPDFGVVAGEEVRAVAARATRREPVLMAGVTK